MPEMSSTAVADYKRLTAPEAAFFEECCEVGGKVLRVNIKIALNEWRHLHSLPRPDKERDDDYFFRRLYKLHPHIEATHTYCHGLRLNDKWKKIVDDNGGAYFDKQFELKGEIVS